ncbi:DUF2500 domain-containing protein [Pseudobacillus wudalianchiensis]|uniref:DUF2500 domain-containing protein n=1 Tax=Pseudobacillus wudalianchiensis TaxID=1743143 RepID=A0A1B9AN59_9BACI|nr:DUF2500 domain-containing protein [Bacillus wudalianchiensis]OCA85246.1 hypothetical protein A8F95_11265 [Bacillus wudalianchiensis]
MYEVSESGDWLFTFAPTFIGIIFVTIFIVIIVNLFKGLSQWIKNEESPRLSVPATAKVKRTNVARHTHHNHHDNTAPLHSSSTTYFITFEFESGDRSEFRVSGKEYGMIAEGDVGTLTFQGTRYIEFTRKN